MDNEGCSFDRALPAWPVKRSPVDGLPLAGRFRHFFRRLTRLARLDLQKLPQHPDRSIHNLRVRMKKLAAVLRLVKSHIRREEYGKMLAATKRLKNAFAQQRDAKVAAQLRGKKKTPPPKASVPQKASGPLFIEVAILEKTLTDAPLENLHQEDVLEAYVKCYHKGRKRMKKCLKKPEPALLHQWRGPVKRFFYQSLLFRRAKGAKSRIKQAKKLGKWLGKDHDRHLLAERARNEQQFKTAKFLDQKREEQQKRIFKLAQKLYKHSPKHLRKKLSKS